MKKIIEVLEKISLIVLAFGMFLISCDDDKKDIPTFNLDKDDIAIDAEGGVEKITITSSEEWVALASDSWLMISPANGVGTTECSIVIDSTLINDMRTASIRFSANNQESKTVTVRQTGFNKIIAIEEAEIEIEASDVMTKRNFSTLVTTNVEFDINIEYENGFERWLEPSRYSVELDRGARPRTTKINFDWRMNPNPEERIARVNFVPSNKEDELKNPAFLTITQKAAPKIEDNRAGDSLAIVTIAEKLQAQAIWDFSDNLRNWDDVLLWEKTDKDLPEEGAVGRIKYVKFSISNTKESIPQEVRHLKYLETLSLYSNSNTMLLSIDLGPEVSELNYLKHLQIGAYGLVSLPLEFIKLGNTLESLDLSGNNFRSIPALLTPENFPKLKSLRIIGNRRWVASDLRKASTYENGLGLHINTETDNSVRSLLMWDNLEELSLSYNYIEGGLPDFKEGENGVVVYNQADVNAFGGDTIQWLADNAIPKILPNMKRLSLNLNFLTGNIPNWLLYHPALLDWGSEIMIFNQMEYGVDSNGNIAKFDNEPRNYQYYFEAFPKYRYKYEYYDDYEFD